ncbi:hypothetical protein B484DRAFT_399634 [Ochromonadaceae sp. CCMP2298]|nr:hypothetical protein B484DRAFT_399634 [Ochromonadaceae sp. CCMP2298]
MPQSPHQLLQLLLLLAVLVNVLDARQKAVRRDGDGHKEPSLLTQVVYKTNEGFDFGAHGTMVKEISKQAMGYEYYIFLNCGVIGPIVPSYLDTSKWHWSSAFTDKMVNNVALVGTSIVCLPLDDESGQLGPKVEGFAFALSSDALTMVMDAGTIFTDHKDKTAAIIEGEYNLTTQVTKRFGLDCLLKAYQGWDWTDESNWNCNSYIHPTKGNYFGMHIHPYETIFHKQHWVTPSANPKKWQWELNVSR